MDPRERWIAEVRAPTPDAGGGGRSRARPFAAEPTTAIGQCGAGAAHAPPDAGRLFGAGGVVLGWRADTLPELARSDRRRPEVSACLRTPEVGR
jgi:hypothetical protein